MAKPIGTLGTIDTITVAGRVFTDLTNLIMLQASTSSGGSSNSTMRLANGPAGYAVTAAKTLKLYAATARASAINNSFLGGLLYSDNDVDMNVSTAFTNPVYMTNNDGGNRIGTTITGMSNPLQEDLIRFDVPATKYVGIEGEGNGLYQFRVFGYEV